MFPLILGVVVFVQRITAHAQVPWSGGMGWQCMEEHCHDEWRKCETNKACLEMMTCNAYCMATWNNDPTTQKVHAQNCTLKCSASFEDNVTDSYFGCMFVNDCLTLPPINESCPVDQLVPNVQHNASLYDLEGEWWQHFGYNALWDCYPCQHIHSMKVYNASLWSYTYSYEIYLVNNSLETYQQTWLLPLSSKTGVPVNITYDYVGSPHIEVWYILSATDRYVVLVDCSYISTWVNVGSIVWVRPNTTLTQSEFDDIAKTYAALDLGWDFPDQFCRTAHEEMCPQ